MTRRTITVPMWLSDIAERAGWTAAQAALAALMAAGTLNADALQVAALAGVAAALALVKSAVTDWLRSGKRSSNPTTDIIERALATFAEVFLAAVLVAPGSPATWKLAALSGAAAALAVLKGLVATRIGKPSASTLPARLDPTPYPWSE